MVRKLQTDLAATREPLTSLGEEWPIDAGDILEALFGSLMNSLGHLGYHV